MPAYKLLKLAFLDQLPAWGGLAVVACLFGGLVVAGFSPESAALLVVVAGPLFVLALYGVLLLVMGALAIIGAVMGGVARLPTRRSRPFPFPESPRAPSR
ncbi:hypothetical protein [Bordetella hinzii]|uniref:hypothetical protein n=1 Tax=Bordetella hinzii TaxID=103855 RepID=UPI00076491E4|nr:hypothetical protein [Bordetella hinzii]KXA71052.1 hypothetical protein AXA74_20330 [Bordetella hinzii LMG 13501]